MNNFREWLSDNLRYILLFLAIALVLVGLFFGVRYVSKAYAERSKDKDFSEDSVLETSEVPTDEVKAEEAKDGEVTATITPTPAEVKNPGPVGGVLQQNAYPAVNALITSYYAALETGDPEVVRGVVDVLTDEDAAKVKEAPKTSYSDIEVYTKDGEAAGTYLVYSSYHYLTEGSSVALPGLSQLFVNTNADGDLRIVTSDLDEATQDFVDDVNAGEDVKALIERVRAEYDSAQAAIEDAAKAAEAQAEAEAKAAEEAAAQAEAEKKAAEEAVAKAAYEAEHKETPAHTISTCNIRSGPGYEYEVIFPDLPGGSEVTVIGDVNSGWRHIRVNGIEGYVGGRFVAY